MATILKVPHPKISHCTFSHQRTKSVKSFSLIQGKGCKTVFDMHYVKQKWLISKTTK